MPDPRRPLLPPVAESAGTTPRLGAHMSIAGGLPRAIERATELGCTAIQIFVKNQQQWTGRTLPAAEAAAFRDARAASSVRHVLAHASYLVNLASPDETARRRSLAALHDEMRRCAALGVDHLVLHPGAHLGSGEAAGLAHVAAGLRRLLEAEDVQSVGLLVECTAGQGSSVGYRLPHLAEILSASGGDPRLGVCLDTCHLFAAGYDFRSFEGFAALGQAIEAGPGWARVRAFHLNDSRVGCGARVDRHAPIGAGHIGRAAFARLLRDPRLQGLPMVLETPGGMPGWRRELQILRRLARPASRSRGA